MIPRPLAAGRFISSQKANFEDNHFHLQNGCWNWSDKRFGISLNNSDTVIVKNNFINCFNFDYDGYGIIASGTNKTVNIENNTIINSQKGMSLNLLQNFVINGNTIVNVKDYFVQIYGNNGTIDNNIMNTIVAGNGVNLFSINTQLRKNKITKIMEGSCIANSANNNTINNNYLHAEGLGVAKGIYSNAANSLTAYNNSINITSVDRMNGKAIEINGGSDITLKNNILSNKEGGYSLFVSGNPGNLDFNYNDYYSFKDKLVHFNGTEYDSLSDWKTASGMDAASVNYNPYYETDTLLKHNQMKLYNAAMQLPSVTTDIYNTSRGTTPDIGAYEYTKCPVDAGVHKFIGLISPLTTGILTPIVVELENHGTSNLTTVIVNWTVNGVSQSAFTWNGNLAQGQTVYDTIGYFTFTPGTTYNLTATTTAPNGGTDCNNFNNSARITELGTQLCGVYTIGGSNPDFLNFTEAAVALNSGGIACSVIFKVRSGIYDEHITLNQIQGASPTATITFESEFGNSFSTGATLYYDTTDVSNDYTLILNGTDYIRFNNMGIQRSNGNGNVFVQNGCKDVRFSNNWLYNVSVTGLDTLFIFKNNQLSNNFLIINYSGSGYSKDLRISNNKIKSLTINKCNLAKIDSNYLSWIEGTPQLINTLHIANSKSIYVSYDTVIACMYNPSTVIAIYSTQNHNINIKNSFIQIPGGCEGVGIQSELDTLRYIENNKLLLQNGIWGWCGSRNAIMANGGDSMYIKCNIIQSPNFEYASTGIYIYDNAIPNYEISDNYIELYRNGMILMNNSANNITKSNKITKVKDFGIKATGNLGLVLRNSIHNIDGGIGIINEATNSKYYQNRITGITNGKAMTNNANGIDIQNNYMHSSGNSQPIGLQFIDNLSNCYVYNNNINITGNDATGSAAFEIQNASNLIVKNNIFANQTNGYALKTNTASASFTSDKNCFFTYGDFLFNRNGQNIQKLNQWITASGQDANSKNINPFYISDTNLKMNQIQLNNNADFVGISLDIDSTSRVSNNDIGAKVFVPCINDAGIDSVVGMIHNLTSPTMTIKGILQNHGTATLSIVNVYYSVNCATPVLLSLPPGLPLGQGATMQISFPIPYTFTTAQSNLKIWTSLPNGVADCNNYNDTSIFNKISGPLCGVYTIGGLNPDFNSIGDAVFALNGVGISCPVIFRLRDTIFNQNVAIGPVKGNSFINTITFERDTFLTTYPGIDYTVTDINNDFALRLDSTTHVTFRKLTINRLNGNRNVWLKNLNNYVTFDSCKVNGLITDTLGVDSVLVIKNCDFQNFPIDIFGDTNLRMSNISIIRTINTGKFRIYNAKNILADSCTFNFSDNNWNFANNIYFENCEKIIIKRNNANIYNGSFAPCINMVKSKDIKIEKNNLTSTVYSQYTNTINISKSNNISIESNIVNANTNYSTWQVNQRNGIFLEKSNGVVIKSNTINSNSFYATNYGILILDSVNNVKIEKNEIKGFTDGMRCNLRSLTDSIIENKVYNVNSTGIRLEGDSAVVQKNRILNSANIIGIHVLSANAKIHQNRILNVTESEGIRVEGTKNLIANNYINITGFGIAKGIVINSGSNYSKIIHNSINITSTDILKGKAIEINGGDYIEVQKNILSNKGGGYGAYLNYKPLGLNAWWVDNNIYSTGSKIGYYNGINYSDYLLFNGGLGIGPDFNQYNPFYASDTNLLPYQRFLNGACTGYSGINIDIDDKLRMMGATDIGAKEFKVDFGITQMLSPSLECIHGSNDTVKIYIKQYGDIPFTDIPLAYSINGGTVNYSMIPGSTFNDITFSFPVTINISNNNTYVFKLWIIDAFDDNKLNDTLIAIRYSKPSPVINFSAPFYCEMRNTNFTSQATVSSPYTIASYQWNFGDGDSANIANPMHVFDSTGIYPVNLRVYSSAGCYKDTLKNVIIHATPNAVFVMGSQCKGVPVNFTNNSSINSLDTLLYNWNFGDYTNSIQKNPTHSYANTGSIPIQLITASLFGCKDTISHNAIIHTLPVIQLNKQNITCNGLVDGKITSIVNSGNPSYHYLWSTNDTTSVINNLLQGMYMLTVTDSYGCVDKDTATIIQPGAITVNFNKKPYVCNGMFNGWIKAIINGGTSPFTYNWNGGLIGDSIINLNNGVYIVTVKDSNNCQKVDSVMLIPKPQPNVQFTHTDVLCYGDNNGTANVIANGGQLPYSYQWSTSPIQTSQNIINLFKGNYIVKVIDSLGCLKTDSVQISQPDSFHFAITYTMPLCNGNSNGKIAVNTTGATSPYTYIWNTIPVQNNAIAYNLSANNYQVIVKDSNNCDTTLQLTLNQPLVLNVQSQTISQSCKNYCDGFITAFASGGTRPYIYSWNTSPVQTDSIAKNLCEGAYEVILKDSNNCTLTHQATNVQTNTHILASFASNPDQGFSPLDVNFVFTGYGAATYNWDFGDGNTSIFQNPMNTFIDDGTYHILLIVESSLPDLCKDTASFELIVDAPSEVLIPNVLTPNGDGVNDYFFIKEKGIVEMKVYIYNRWGVEIYVIEKPKDKWDGTYLNNPASEGTYFYVLKAKGKDNKEYEKHGSVTLLR
ncbi:MAG: gliding motility-associated C-terminal domain-containing protein [Bacteroidetes bacterium]|nr:gliding motility-associated C-terminal domain-containing protein [Bacteroidota bacterium]